MGTGEPAGEGYQQLTVKEAADIELLMERSELAVSDAQVFAQTLSTDLQVLDKVGDWMRSNRSCHWIESDFLNSI